MQLEAFAKINWTLDIIGQRDDGYHLMDMLMQPVSLADEITISPSRDIELSVSGSPSVRADAKNLAYRAAVLLRQTGHVSSGAHIHLSKKIPVGAGLGGGSADAAAVLLGLNRLWQLQLSGNQLEELGLTLGADVPFCVRGGLCRTTGIGEHLESCDCTHHYYILLVQPCRGLSTGEVFSAYHEDPGSERPRTDQALSALQCGDLTLLASSLGNVLEAPAVRMRPEINQACTVLLEYGALAARMTGSGSAVFGLFRTGKAASEAYAICSRRWKNTYLCHTQQDSVRIYEDSVQR